jgi:hypothetical protein
MTPPPMNADKRRLKTKQLICVHPCLSAAYVPFLAAY